MLKKRINRRGFLGTSLGLSLAGMIGTPGGKTARSAETITLDWKDNKVIQSARKLAIDILKPSAKDLEHGLALHAESLVFDGYGFSPRAAVDGEAIQAAIEAHASPIELQDLREDGSMTRCVTDPVERAEYEQAWRASGVTCVFQNAGEEGQDPMRLIKRLARFTYLTDMMRDFVAKAARPDDIQAAKKRGKHCLYFTGNGVPLRQHWVSVEDELRYIRVFFQLGIRMMHLTYQRRNMIGDGCGESTDAGLSDFGRTVVAEMNRQGVIVDIAHSGWKTSFDAAKASNRPMVASHTTCTSLYNHYRSKPDEVIRAICDTGGQVGICCVPRYLGGSADINALLDHVDYVAKKFGDDHVSIGTDVAYQSRNAAAQNRKMSGRPHTREQWRMLWPESPNPGGNARSMCWTNWPLYTVGLVQRGYSDDAIRKIIGGNVLRVARDVLK